MTQLLQFGSISFGGFRLFALPENYQVIATGNKSKPIPRAGGTILDIGYGYLGFNIRTSVHSGSTVAAIDDYAKGRLASGTPISVVDTLYPGGKTRSGFFELAIQSTGSTSAGVFGLPSDLMLEDISLTFYSIEEEIL